MKRRDFVLAAVAIVVVCLFVTGFWLLIKSAALGAVHYHGPAEVPADFFDDAPLVFLGTMAAFGILFFVAFLLRVLTAKSGRR